MDANDSASDKPRDLQLLDDLIKKCHDALKKEVETKPKLGDFLKMIELRRKLTPHDESQRELWDLLEQARADALDVDPDIDTDDTSSRITASLSEDTDARDSIDL